MLDVNQSYTAMKPLKAVIVSARVHPGESLRLKTFRHGEITNHSTKPDI